MRLFVTTWSSLPGSMRLPKQEYWVSCHFLLQGIFPTQGLNTHLCTGRQILYHPTIMEAYGEQYWGCLKSRQKRELSYDPAVPSLGIYLEKTTAGKDTYTSVFIAALFTVARMWHPKCPINRGMEEDVVCVCGGVLLSCQKGWNDAMCSNLEFVILRERQTYDIVYSGILKKMLQMNFSMKQKDFNVEKKLMVTG